MECSPSRHPAEGPKLRSGTLPSLLASTLVLVSACQAGGGVDPHPPDLTGWTRLPVENLRVFQDGEMLRVRVSTTTPTAEWTVKLHPWEHEEAPPVYRLELAGRSTRGPAAMALTIHRPEAALKLGPATRWIEVIGSNGSFRVAVPEGADPDR